MSFNLTSLVRPNIQKLKPYASARDEFTGRAEIYLDANENPFNTGLNRYPDPLQKDLKIKIGQIKGLTPENIFLGNGSDEAIDLLLRIFCEPQKDEIITLPPTYGMYQVSADIANVFVKKIPLTRDFQPDTGAILAAARLHSKLLFLCSPNNPTGNHFQFEKIKRLCTNFSGIVVIDEAYIDFSKKQSALTLLAHFPNLVVLQTFSKAWGLAGIRLGMAFASSEIISLFNKVKPPYNINLLSQKAALQNLENKNKHQFWVRTIIAQRVWLRNQLMLYPFVKKIHPSDANFLLVEVEHPNELYKYLIQKNIIVRNRSNVPLCRHCLRFTIGTPTENRQLLAVLDTW